jgi:SAM-dependent methyltransferase
MYNIRKRLRLLPSEVTLENICSSRESFPISYWAPRREEIQRFIEIAKAVHTGEGKPKILDIGCGVGFLAYLLAETGEVEVIGMDPIEYIETDNPYQLPNLKLEVGNSKDAVERYANQNFDVVLNSWMPCGLNLTPDIRDIEAKVIIYIKEREATGIPGYQYGEYIYEDGFEEYEIGAEEHRVPNPIAYEDGVSYEPGKNYSRAFNWSGPSFCEINDFVEKLKNPDAYVGPDKNLNYVDIQFRKDVKIPVFDKIKISDLDKYNWERGLELMAGPLEPMMRYQSLFF